MHSRLAHSSKSRQASAQAAVRARPRQLLQAGAGKLVLMQAARPTLHIVTRASIGARDGKLEHHVAAAAMLIGCCGTHRALACMAA